MKVAEHCKCFSSDFINHKETFLGQIILAHRKFSVPNGRGPEGDQLTISQICAAI